MLELRTAITDPKVEQMLHRLQSAQEQARQQGRQDGESWAAAVATREELSEVAGKMGDWPGQKLAANTRGDDIGYGASHIFKWLPDSFTIGTRWAPNIQRHETAAEGDLWSYLEGWRDAVKSMRQLVNPILNPTPAGSTPKSRRPKVVDVYDDPEADAEWEAMHPKLAKEFREEYEEMVAAWQGRDVRLVVPEAVARQMWERAEEEARAAADDERDPRAREERWLSTEDGSVELYNGDDEAVGAWYVGWDTPQEGFATITRISWVPSEGGSEEEVWATMERLAGRPLR